MNCPACGYSLSPFDKDCPRCKNFAARGLKVPSQQPASIEDIIPDVTPQVVYEQVTPNPPLGTPYDTTQPSPAQSFPAAYNPQEYRKPNSTPNMPVILVIVVLLVLYAMYHASQVDSDQFAQQQAIIQAARQGSCDKLLSSVGGGNCSTSNTLVDGCVPSVNMQGDNEAVVTFTLPQGGVYDRINVGRDVNGTWRAQ